MSSDDALAAAGGGTNVDGVDTRPNKKSKLMADAEDLSVRPDRNRQNRLNPKPSTQNPTCDVRGCNKTEDTRVHDAWDDVARPYLTGLIRRIATDWPIW